METADIVIMGGCVAKNSELLHDFQDIQFVPMLDEHAVLNKPNVYTSHGDVLLRSWNTQERSSMSGSVGIAPNHLVSCKEGILYGNNSIRERDKPVRKELLDTLQTRGNKRIMVDIRRSNKGIKQIDIVCVQRLSKPVSKCNTVLHHRKILSKLFGTN